jgi:hypothetical protein
MLSGYSTYLHDIERIYLRHYAATQSGFTEATAFDRPTLQLTGVTAVCLDSVIKNYDTDSNY